MTEEFQQDTDETPVLFRIHRQPKTHGGEVTAIFPCEPADLDGRTMTCYAHVGQHASCDFGWYQETRHYPTPRFGQDQSATSLILT
jgi:hypothetical protein